MGTQLGLKSVLFLEIDHFSIALYFASCVNEFITEEAEVFTMNKSSIIQRGFMMNYVSGKNELSRISDTLFRAIFDSENIA